MTEPEGPLEQLPFPEDRLLKTYLLAVHQNSQDDEALTRILVGAMKVAYRRGFIAARLPYGVDDVEYIGHQFFDLAKLMRRMLGEEPPEDEENAAVVAVY